MDKEARAIRRSFIWMAVGVLVCVVSAGVVVTRVVGSVVEAECPHDDAAQQRRGLDLVEHTLGAGVVTEQSYSECDSGEGPRYTVSARGQGDPVQTLLAADPAWIRGADDPDGASLARRSFEGSELSVSSSPEQPGPGVTWSLSVWVG